ncbi:hypothetical protein JK182_09570 [Acetobacter okinawensis]|uniref:hypothetical protein n=1 Tax=Acetobacter okinawensis TaxID=1076594 RepID=UPI001BAB4275|nr:hypothetical protein [Acetobacter okinawensis]MBS0988909.1 hypothetical protein [Acetobacter okinawensis]
MTDKQTTSRLLLQYGGSELVFGFVWALLIAVIGSIALRYLTVALAPGWENCIVWVTVALATIAVGAMLIGPVWLAKHMRKNNGVGNDR